jgi:hypothetical protein
MTAVVAMLADTRKATTGNSRILCVHENPSILQIAGIKWRGYSLKPTAGPSSPLCSGLCCVFEKREQIIVNRLSFGRRHPMRKALIGLQCAVFQQLCRQRSCICIRHDLVITRYDQHDVRVDAPGATFKCRNPKIRLVRWRQSGLMATSAFELSR